jgi:hypothetical protein
MERNPFFVEWLWDQQERIDEVGKIAKLTWHDKNSGCALPFRFPIMWEEHFHYKHKAKASELIRLIRLAGQEYLALYAEK